MEWATFTMDGNVLGVSDGSTLKSRTFVGVRGTGSAYTLALYDGESSIAFRGCDVDDVLMGDPGVSNTTQTIVPLTLNLVRSASTSVLRW
jgi:hypothetical protein